MTLLIKDLSEISDFERIALSDFSYSRIDTYRSCPSKYFYTYIQKEPRGFAPAAALRKYSSFCFARQRRKRY